MLFQRSIWISIVIYDSISVFWSSYPLNFCLCVRRQCLLRTFIIIFLHIVVLHVFYKVWFLFTLIARRQDKERMNSSSSFTAYLHSTAVQSETLVHEDRFVLWPRSWVPGTMAAALSWQSPSIFSTWRGPSGWTISCDKHQPSSTGIFLGMLVHLPNIMFVHISFF